MSQLNLRRVWSWASASLGLLALVIQFQNCAPSGAPGESDEFASEVRVIDDWGQKAIVFPEEMVQLHDETLEFLAQGLCPRKGEASLKWTLQSEAGAVREGEAACEMGGFQISLENMDQLECGVHYVLHVSNAGGQQAETWVSRKCPPLLAQQSYSNPDSGEACFFELETSPLSLDPVCYEACYIGDKLAYRESTHRSQCGQQLGGG